uniref:Uncharacterized protein n=1 Tax=Lutzomyia longipalpis TaxID=7200 RepID=A0A1B0CDF5_LUTLO
MGVLVWRYCVSCFLFSVPTHSTNFPFTAPATKLAIVLTTIRLGLFCVLCPHSGYFCGFFSETFPQKKIYLLEE